MSATDSTRSAGRGELPRFGGVVPDEVTPEGERCRDALPDRAASVCDAGAEDRPKLDRRLSPRPEVTHSRQGMLGQLRVAGSLARDARFVQATLEEIKVLRIVSHQVCNAAFSPRQ